MYFSCDLYAAQKKLSFVWCKAVDYSLVSDLSINAAFDADFILSVVEFEEIWW